MTKKRFKYGISKTRPLPETTFSRKELLAFYERFYFHEIDVREKLSSRLQVPLAIIVALLGVLGYVLQRYEHTEMELVAKLFLGTLLLSIALIVGSSFFFVRSYFNHNYNFVPSAKDCEAHYKAIFATYEPYAKSVRDELVDRHFSNHLLRYFIDCSTVNTQANDLRSLHLHRTNACLIAAAISVFATYATFYLGNLDKEQLKKPTEISVVGPVKVSPIAPINTVLQLSTESTSSAPLSPRPHSPGNSSMNAKSPPPDPPKPPPPRQIREGVQIVPPPPPKPNPPSR